MLAERINMEWASAICNDEQECPPYVEWTLQLRWLGCIPWKRVLVADLFLFFAIF